MRTYVSCIVLAVAALAAPLGPAGAQEPASATITTVYGGTGGCTLRRSVSVPVGVPAPVDAGGTAEPDLLVHLLAAPPPVGDGAATLSVERLTTSAIRVSVSVAVDQLSFGYDACATGAPGSFRANAVASSDSTTLTVDTSNATAALRITGEQRGGATKRLHADLRPVPASTTVTVARTASGVTGTLRTDRPTRLEVGYTEGSSTAVDVLLDRFPGTATIEADPSGLRYTASATVDAATIEIRRGTQRLDLALSGVPTDVRVDRTGPTHATLRSGPIGSATVTFVSGSLSPPAASGDHLAVRKVGGALAARVRLRGVTAADLDWGDPVLVDVRHAGGPFTIAAELDGLDVASTIRDLPSRAIIRSSRDGRTLSYEGSAVIGELTATVRRSTPLFGRATRASLLARGIPPTLDLELSPSGSSFELDANGASVGSVEVLATSGPDERLPSSYDGLLLRDLPDRWVAFARVTGLRRVTYSETTTVLSSVDIPFVGRVSKVRRTTSADLGTSGGRPMLVNVHQTDRAEPDDVSYVTMSLTSLPRDVSATVTRDSLRFERTGAESDGTMRIAYDASSRTGGLSFRTDAGDRYLLQVGLEPMPSSIDVCTSPGSECAPALSPADKGTQSVRASERTHLTVYDCAKPDGGCNEDYTSVDLYLQTFAVGADERSDGFEIFLDTDRQPVSGRVIKQVGDETEYDLRFPNVSSDLWTQDRAVIVSCGAFSCSGDASGSMHCPSGTVFRVNTHHWRWGIADFAEEICPG